MKSVLRFPVNTPTEVALRYEVGKRVEGRYGEQVMYSLADDHVMYVPPNVARRIEELAIAAGEPFEILRREARSGNRKWVEWRVRRKDPEETETRQPEQPPLEIVSAPAQAKPNGRGANGAAKPEPAEAAFDPAENGVPQPVPPPITGAGIRAMELALGGAAEIAQRIEARAAERSYLLRFSSEDIRAIGLTLFIQAMREGAARWQG